jgi:hypothetical protein
MKPIVKRGGWRRVARALASLAALPLVAAFAPVTVARAQNYKYEIRLEGGGWYPTGAIADELKNAGTVGATASWTFSPDWSALISGSWTPSREKDPAAPQHVNIYQYDLGIEWSTMTGEVYRWEVSPFVGAGLGSRSYSPQRLGTPSQSVFDGYLAAGVSFGSDQETWRIGIRNCVSGWKGIIKTTSTTGDDVAIIAGIGFRF